MGAKSPEAGNLVGMIVESEALVGAEMDARCIHTPPPATARQCQGDGFAHARPFLSIRVSVARAPTGASTTTFLWPSGAKLTLNYSACSTFSPQRQGERMIERSSPRQNAIERRHQRLRVPRGGCGYHRVDIPWQLGFAEGRHTDDRLVIS